MYFKRIWKPISVYVYWSSVDKIVRRIGEWAAAIVAISAIIFFVYTLFTRPPTLEECLNVLKNDAAEGFKKYLDSPREVHQKRANINTGILWQDDYWGKLQCEGADTNPVLSVLYYDP